MKVKESRNKTIRQTKWHEELSIGLTLSALWISLLFNGFSYLTSLFIVDGEIIGGPTKQKGIIAFTSLIEQSLWKYPIILLIALISFAKFREGYRKYNAGQTQKDQVEKSFFSFTEIPNQQDYINNLDFLIQKFDLSFSYKKLQDNYLGIYFANKKRSIDLIFTPNGNLIRVYILNSEFGTPSYKDYEKSLKLEYLDLVKTNSDRNQGMNWFYSLSKSQQLSELKRILIENKKVIKGEYWPESSFIIKQYSKNYGQTISYKWKPNPQLAIIKKELDYLASLGYVKIYDDDEKPEYQEFSWEMTLIYENNSNHAISIHVDYRGQCNTMCFKENNVWSDSERLDYEKIRNIVNTTPNNV